MNDEDRMAEAQARYEEHAHAVQSGVAYEMPLNSLPTEPKHLRTGIDLGKAEHAGLVKLLVKKGVITDLEYMEAMAEAAEAEHRRYEKHLSEIYGREVTLL